MRKSQAVQAAIKGSWLDRAIGVVAPRVALKRAQARATMAIAGKYNGGSRSRRATKGWGTSGADADTDLADREVMIARSQELFCNSPLARGAINTNVTSVIGSGLELGAAIDREYLGMSDDEADAWEGAAEREWRLFSETPECDVERKQNFAGLQVQVLRSSLLCGDVFSLLPMFQRAGSPYQTKVQLVEAPRVCNPQFGTNRVGLVDGVEKNTLGAAIAFYILKQHPQSMLPDARRYEWERYEAFGANTGRRNVLHVGRFTRIGATRGEPYLAPVIEKLRQLTQYAEEELYAATVAALFTVFITSEDGNADLDAFDDDSEPTAEGEDYKLGRGAMIGLRPGENVSTATPGRPNQAFKDFVTAVTEEIGVALEIPHEVLIKHFTSSYSAAQASLLEVWRFFRTSRTWISSSFCQPVYEAVLLEAVASGRLSAPGFLSGDPLVRKAYCGSEWTGPGRGQIRGDVETKAAVQRIEAGLSTRKREALEINGSDADRVHKRLVREEQQRTRDGLVASAGGAQGDASGGFKAAADAYGVAVRAGAITPQLEDEEHLRRSGELPPMSGAALAAWRAEQVRRPITITPIETMTPSGDEE